MGAIRKVSISSVLSYEFHSEISDKEYTITLSLATTFMWNDTRLELDRMVLHRIAMEERWFALDHRLEGLIWTPKPKIINIRSEQVDFKLNISCF